MAGWRADFSPRRTVVSHVGSDGIVANSLIISMASIGIINLRHPLVRLAGKIDWNFLAGRFSSVCRVVAGGWAVDPQAHAQPLRRGAVRAMGREPVFPVLVRGSGVPARAAV